MNWTKDTMKVVHGFSLFYDKNNTDILHKIYARCLRGPWAEFKLFLKSSSSPTFPYDIDNHFL